MFTKFTKFTMFIGAYFAIEKRTKFTPKHMRPTNAAFL